MSLGSFVGGLGRLSLNQNGAAATIAGFAQMSCMVADLCGADKNVIGKANQWANIGGFFANMVPNEDTKFARENVAFQREVGTFQRDATREQMAQMREKMAEIKKAREAAASAPSGG